MAMKKNHFAQRFSTICVHDCCGNCGCENHLSDIDETRVFEILNDSDNESVTIAGLALL